MAAVLAGATVLAGAPLVTPAHAGDVPAKDGNRYMRQCTSAGSDFYGGFWQIPGSDTCISFGGYLWAEGYYNSYTDAPPGNRDTYSIATYGLQLDTRTETEYGLLRSYMDFRIQYRSVEEWGAPLPGGATTEVIPWTLYVQFAGFTFGRLTSMFDFYANQNVLGTDPGTIGDDTQTNMMAYTWDFSHGWSATFSIEDSSERAAGVAPADAYSGETLQAQADVPELVANLGQSGDWGQFQLSGALHRAGAESVTNNSAGIPVGAGYDVGSVWGYAVQAGVMFNLPHIAKGDTLYLQSAYVDGAISYLGLVNASGDFSPPDAFLNDDGSFSRVTGWNATFQYLHNFTSRWNASVFGGYAEFDLNNAVAQATIGASGGINYNLGGNITWQATDAFSLTLQYDYNMYKAKDYVDTGNGLPVRAQEASQLLLMAQRLF